MGSGDQEELADLEAGRASAQRAVDDLVAEQASAVAREASIAANREPVPDAVREPIPPPTDLTAAAFFDVDNTLVQGSSLVHFGRGLAARQYFTYSDMWKFVYAQAKFQLTGRENSDDVAEGRRKALAFIEGRSTAELAALGEEIYDDIIADKIWPGTRALAQMHLDAGQQVWLVTATPYELADIIAKRLGFTGALGTVAESENGVFTGRLVGDILHGLGKAHAVRAAGHPRRTQPQTLHGLLRQLQRRADAVAGRHRGRHQPRRRPARAGPRAGLGDPRLPDRPQGRPDRGALGAGARGDRRRAGRGRVPAARALTPRTSLAERAATAKNSPEIRSRRTLGADGG